MRSSRLVFQLVRALIAVLGALLGAYLALFLLERNILTGPNNILYLTLLGLLTAYLFSGPPARWIERMGKRARGMPPEAVLAGLSGAIVGLLITVLINNVLAAAPWFTWYWSLLIALFLVAAVGAFFIANRSLFGAIPRREAREEREEKPAVQAKLVDTSAIIDGRLVDVIGANFLEGTLLVPRFVLTELQQIADSGDPDRRRRGRRGLEVLEKLQQQEVARVEILPGKLPDGGEVDQELVALARSRGASLLTTDYNLEQVAALQGVTVLNLNGLAAALKPAYLPGDELTLQVVRKGKEAGQGLGYLSDGTMVVIEEAADRLGHEVTARVTSSLQTNVGRMIFARHRQD